LSQAADTREARIARILLGLVALFGTLAIGSTAILIIQYRDLEGLEAQMLAEVDLQRQMMSENPSSKAIYPHAVSEIGFVLNPGMERASFAAPDDYDYAVNSIGLRGEEIEAKKPGVKRIALVGDSILFGWRVRDDERLGAQLQRLVDEKVGPGKVEFVTIAIPGWNTESEAAFLEHHLARIQPDFLVWYLLENDTHDAPGVAPPGQMVGFYSPQRRHHRFTFKIRSADHYYYPLPTWDGRWAAALGHVDAFHRRHPIPTLLVAWMVDPRPFSRLVERVDFPHPILLVPQQLRTLDDWPVSAPYDYHPSGWANSMLMPQLVARLTDLGALPRIVGPEELRESIQALGRLGPPSATKEETEAYFGWLASQLPSEYRAGELHPNRLLYDLRKGRMLEDGFLMLRDPGGATHFEVEFELDEAQLQARRTVEFEALNREGGFERLEVPIDQAKMRVSVPLPKGSSYPVHELRWQFDFTECRSPSACEAARFVRAALEAGE